MRTPTLVIALAAQIGANRVATRTLIDHRGLIHGHPYKIDPYKMQWHAASTSHYSDPTAHAREHSWDEPNWSRNGKHWALGYDEMTARLEAARNACEKATEAYLERNKASADTAEQLLPQEAPRPTFTATPTVASNASGASDPKLVERVGDLEDFQLMLAEQIKTADTRAASAKAQAATTAERIDSITRKMRLDTERDIADIERQLDKTYARIKSLEEAAEKRVVFEVRTPTQTTVLKGAQHANFETLLNLALSLDGEDRNIWLTGPAGSGKTSAARKLAEALALPFDFQGAIDMSHKLSGFIDAGGNYHSTPFRRIYENGGIILLDECDGSSAGALLELNAALANSHASFPDGLIPRHKDTYVIAAANTWGFGGDANYVGRNKLDAAFLDRFVTLSWPYDEVLERNVAAPEGRNSVTDKWVTVVQAVRRSVFDKGAVGMVISPRASIKGAQLLRAGMSPKSVVEAVFGRYRSHSAWPSVGAAAEKYAELQQITAASASTPNITANTNTNGLPATGAVTSGAGANGSTSKLGTIDMSKAVVFSSNYGGR